MGMEIVRRIAIMSLDHLARAFTTGRFAAAATGALTEDA